MSVDYSKLIPGQKISGQNYVLDADTVSRYIDAVDDRSRLYSEDKGRGLVPPMAVSALSLRSVINALEIPGGTLHVGQEFSLFMKRAKHHGWSGCNCSTAKTSTC